MYTMIDLLYFSDHYNNNKLKKILLIFFLSYASISSIPKLSDLKPGDSKSRTYSKTNGKGIWFLLNEFKFL